MSFDAMLLKKEYKKCLTYLSPQETTVLNSWVRKQPFSDMLIPEYLSSKKLNTAENSVN